MSLKMKIGEIALRLRSADEVLKEIERKKRSRPGAIRPVSGKPYVAPRTQLEESLAAQWREMFGLDRVGIDDSFFELGGNSIRAAMFLNKLQQELGEFVYAVALFDAPTIAQLATYLCERYPDAVSRIFGAAALGGTRRSEHSFAGTAGARIDSEKVARLRDLIKSTPHKIKQKNSGKKNPPAIFILAPPRSGTTLLRVMLAGHPKIFSPPELQLLFFQTLQERKAAFPERTAFWLEGTVRAVMQARGCDAQQAKNIMQSCEKAGITTKQFYRLMQQWIGNRILVDKTPFYSLDIEVLKRAEEQFQNALYIHLLRHPNGMIRSFEEARMEQVFWHENPFSVSELAEMVWLISHENILEFLKDVPPHRQHQISFEELVKYPDSVVEDLCRFLGLDLHPAMLEPHKYEAEKMIDGIQGAPRMLGDLKFHTHSNIDQTAADRWKLEGRAAVLADITWKVAEQLGYEPPAELQPEDETARPERRVLQPIPSFPRRETAVPLSFTQSRLWFVNQLDPGSPAYNAPLAIRLTGALDRQALAGALDEIVKRHESLRTSFVDIGGRPAQQIAPAAGNDRDQDYQPVALPFIDLYDTPSSEREARADSIILAEARRPFNLSKGPLLRCALLRVGQREHILVVVLHHIVTDGWSLGIFLKELGILYNSLASGRPARLPELRVQYPDYAQWQRNWLRGEILEEHLGYWRRQLAGAPPLIELPADKPRPPVQTYRGKKQTLTVEREMAEGLREMSRREGVTLFMTLLAAFQVLVSRYSGQTDIVIGTPVANRTRVELEGVIGPFVNTLVMRTDLGDRPSFRELLKRVRQVALGAYAHQDLPFERLVDELSPVRDPARNPVFQVLFVLQNAPLKRMEFSGLELNPEPIEHTISKFDLSLMVSQRRGMKLTLAYASDLFNDTTITRMLGHFRALIEGILADPDQAISDVPLLSAAERNQLLADWNRTEQPYSKNRCVHRLFEEQVERTPDSVALVFDNEQLRYAELDTLSGIMARRLQNLGVGPEVLVAICVERSIEMIIGLLAVLKAGGAYLPLDPSYPARRLEFMLEDSGAPVLLTERRLLKRLPAHPKVVELDRALCTGRPHNAAESETVPERAESVATSVTAGNPAYVIYTSGSTGEPKGVVVQHDGVCNLAEAQVQMFEAGPDSRLLQFASLSFDASASEIFVALLSGAALVLAPRETLMPGPGLLYLLRRQAITTVTLPPTVLSALSPESLPALRTVMSAGEACTVDIISRWAAGRRFLNGYGPTESTVAATTGIHSEQSERPDIGRPLPNTRIYILDEQLQPAPVGVAGRLYISGAGLARGYFNGAALTAERFMPDPFSSGSGLRMYDSGDLARYREDGKIEFIGRKDHQVKLAGHRIELGEIEAALSDHPAVQAGVAAVTGKLEEDKRLVCYIVWAEKARCSVGELRKYLRSKLPDYMTPSSFTVLESLPLLPNGKVNRKTLPEPDRARPKMLQEYVAPRNDLERTLVRLWESVLGLDRAGIHDNFFELGGNSIRAAVVINKLQQRLGEVVYIVALFDAPTIAELARYIEKNHPASASEILGVELDAGGQVQAGPVNAASLALIRELIPTQPPLDGCIETRNPQAIFILCPPRSGSTLLRVMLAGHPALFAPPELELLSFNTMNDRKAALSGKFSFWLEGTIRAVMEIERCDADEARAIVEQSEQKGLTTRQFYRQMQDRIGDRRLVDKTPAYALDLQVLSRSESYFEDALYIHLLRHPSGMIQSFEEARLDQLFFRYEHRFARRELAELVWTLSQQNIIAFLEGVPRERQHRVIFEELVETPEAVLRGVCDFLGIAFDVEMLSPYQEKARRMTDGIHPLSRMLGDVKFHEHAGIDRASAVRWKESGGADLLGDITREVADSLGYPGAAAGSKPNNGFALRPGRALAPIEVPQHSASADSLIDSLDQLSDEEVDSLLSSISSGELSI